MDRGASASLMYPSFSLICLPPRLSDLTFPFQPDRLKLLQLPSLQLNAPLRFSADHGVDGFLGRSKVIQKRARASSQQFLQGLDLRANGLGRERRSHLLKFFLPRPEAWHAGRGGHSQLKPQGLHIEIDFGRHSSQTQEFTLRSSKSMNRTPSTSFLHIYIQKIVVEDQELHSRLLGHVRKRSSGPSGLPRWQ